VLAHVADQVDDDVAARELPSPFRSLETIAVATGDDRLEGQLAGDGLEHREVGTGGSRHPAVVDLDDDVRREVLGPGGAVLVANRRRLVERSYGFGASGDVVRTLGRELGVGKELSQPLEVPGVDSLGVEGEEDADLVSIGAGDGPSVGRGADRGAGTFTARRELIRREFAQIRRQASVST
jgi:hypothetical protein